MASTHDIYLPVELLLKIFLLQPVKSLLRLRCVCKLWNQVITSNSFIKAHVDHHKPTANKYLLRRHYKSCSVNFIDSQSNNVLRKSHNCNIIHRIFGVESQCRLAVRGRICNGLVCLSSDCNTLHGSVFLWNPIVNKVKKLPIIRIKVKPAWCTYMCFGYYSDDYKVVKVAPISDMYHVYVYSLSTDCWEFYKCDITSDGDDVVSAKEFDLLTYPNPRLVNGVAYFIKNSSYGDCHRILCFDLRCEMTREINFPEECHENSASHWKFTLEKYEESIALVALIGCPYDLGPFNKLMMWVLRVEPSHNSFSWDRKYTVELEREYQFELSEYQFELKDFINNENLVIKKMPSSRRSPEYFLYNVHDADSKGRRFRILEDKDEVEDEDSWAMDDWGLHLEENLVLLDETTNCEPFC